MLCGFYLVYHQLQQDNHKVPEYVAPSGSNQSPKVLDYQGQRYIQRSQLQTYLFMGIDMEWPATGSHSYIGGGQADVQMVLVVDRFNHTWQLLQINRDSMVEVPVLGVTGVEVGTEYQQIALAHSYGDGGTISCKNNVTAVSRMLNHQYIDGYLALNADGIPLLNDAMGGVTVTLSQDLSHIDPALVAGRTISLNGQQAQAYVQSRQGVGDESNASRMERQMDYLTALFSKLGTISPETVTYAYQEVSDYLVTNLDTRLLTLFQQVNSYTMLPTLTIQGETYLDDAGCAAYQLDEDSLTRTIIQLFYQVDSPSKS